MVVAKAAKEKTLSVCEKADRNGPLQNSQFIHVLCLFFHFFVPRPIEPGFSTITVSLAIPFRSVSLLWLWLGDVEGLLLFPAAPPGPPGLPAVPPTGVTASQTAHLTLAAPYAYMSVIEHPPQTTWPS